MTNNVLGCHTVQNLFRETGEDDVISGTPTAYIHPSSLYDADAKDQTETPTMSSALHLSAVWLKDHAEMLLHLIICTSRRKTKLAFIFMWSI